MEARAAFEAKIINKKAYRRYQKTKEIQEREDYEFTASTIFLEVNAKS